MVGNYGGEFRKKKLTVYKTNPEGYASSRKIE